MADARDLLRAYLTDLGLDSEIDWSLEQLIEGRSAEAVQLDLERRPAFAARFPGFAELQRAGKAISVNEWISYEKTTRGLMRARGIPTELYDSAEDIAKFIRNEVSVAEIQQRIDATADLLDREVDTQAFEDLYGVSTGALIGALVLDPERGQNLVMRQVRAAQAAGAARQAGYQTLDQAIAEKTGGYGVSREEAVQGFGTLAAQRELFNSTNRGEDTIDVGTQVGATFGGDADARARIEQRRRRRQTEYEAGGEFATGRAGFSGLR